MDKMMERTVNIEELEKAATYLLESLAGILAVAGPSYSTAHDDLVRLIKSSRLMEPEFVKRSAYSLANAVSEIPHKASHAVLEVKGGDQPEAAAASTEGRGADLEMKVDGQLANMFLNMIHHVVSISPNNYKVEVEALARLLKSGAGLEEILQRFLDLVIQIREDLLVGRAHQSLQTCGRNTEKPGKDGKRPHRNPEQQPLVHQRI